MLDFIFRLSTKTKIINILTTCKCGDKHKIMHFGTWFMENVPAARKKIKETTPPELKVEAARDGQEFNI